MREILEYYLDNADQVLIHQNELSFEFGNYLISYSFSNDNILNEEDEFFSFNVVNDVKIIEELLRRDIKFLSYEIKGLENLGCREDVEDVRSVSCEMFFFIKKIKLFNEELLGSFSLDTVFSDPMCDKYGTYQFTIKINKGYFWDLDFSKYVIDLFKLNTLKTPSFYSFFFKENISIYDSKEIPVLTTNTKVRRLGYFKILSNFFKEFKKTPSVFINKKFEKFCLDYKDSLEKNSFTKGLIKETKSGISAKPYLDTAVELKLMSKINNAFHIGKAFKVYEVLQKKYSLSSNIFELSDFDKMYFLENILRNDYFYFSNLIEIIFIEENVTYAFLVNKYQGQLISRLKEYKESDLLIKRKSLNNLEAILKRIKSWEKPDVYLEHLIMPRINWMLDLEILSEKNKVYTMTEIGVRLFNNLSIWNDLNTNKIISPNSFLDRFMIHLYHNCYNSTENQKSCDLNFILDRMHGYIKQSFGVFKTLAPNRVTVSQAVNYTKYMLYLNDNITVGYQFILNKLSEKEQDIFIFKYQEQYRDGYIQLKK